MSSRDELIETRKEETLKELTIANGEYPSETIEYASHLIREGDNLLFHRTPSGLAAGALYAACLKKNVDATQEDLSDLFDVSQVTIRKRYSEYGEIAQRH